MRVSAEVRNQDAASLLAELLEQEETQAQGVGLDTGQLGAGAGEDDDELGRADCGRDTCVLHGGAAWTRWRIPSTLTTWMLRSGRWRSRWRALIIRLQPAGGRRRSRSCGRGWRSSKAASQPKREMRRARDGGLRGLEDAPLSSTQELLRIWAPCVAMLMLSLLSYVDRSVLAILSPTILSDLHLSATQYTVAVAVFSWCYMLANPLWGFWMDHRGLFTTTLAAVFLWSLASGRAMR